ATIVARSHERVVLDAHGLAESELPQQILRWTIGPEAEMAADGRGRRRARILARLRRPTGGTHTQRRLVGALDTQEMNLAHAADDERVAVRHLCHPLLRRRGRGHERDEEHSNHGLKEGHVASVLKNGLAWGLRSAQPAATTMARCCG